MVKLLIGTGNPSKLKYLQDIIGDLAQCVSPLELQVQPAVEESGRTATDNAFLKAKAYYEATGLPALSLDAGMVFCDLPLDHPDQPGTHIRRVINGEETTDEEMLAYYIELTRRHGGRLRTAYQDGYCLYAGPDRVFLLEQPMMYCEGSAFWMVDQPSPLRHPGWPLDSISISMVHGHYFVENWRDTNISADSTRNRWLEIRDSWLRDAVTALRQNTEA